MTSPVAATFKPTDDAVVARVGHIERPGRPRRTMYEINAIGRAQLIGAVPSSPAASHSLKDMALPAKTYHLVLPRVSDQSVT
eukprot:CAMPEP_0117609956 /NCGR_PEP_ID=MMETSP0784-20121206/81614_1 /TAXON_ID=39447 /ORGANISM="" /LENGTH=81 /DNA_ID=CAMNT_0005413323 /DNA_START=307 /DNA_END=548 /DNA_ORIENTATION=+